MKNFRFYWVVLLLVLFSLMGCASSATVDESADADAQLAKYSSNQPVIVYDRSVERALMLGIMDARVKTSNTYSFFLTPMTGRPVYSCPSFGFPVPGTAQLSNPDQVVKIAGAYRDVTVAQIDPSGIYTPPSTDATYIGCRLTNGNIGPVYWEPPVASFPFPVKWVDDQWGGHFEPADDTSVTLIDASTATTQFDVKKFMNKDTYSQNQDPGVGQ